MNNRVRLFFLCVLPGVFLAVTACDNPVGEALEAISTSKSVIYDGNGATSGTAPADENVYMMGETVTVLDRGSGMIKAGYVFSGWNTAADGSGDDYAADDTFTINEYDVTLYAQWAAVTIYTAGYFKDGSGIAKGAYWIGSGVYYFVNSVNTYCNSITVPSGTIYIVGSYGGIPFVSIDGSSTILAAAGSANAVTVTSGHVYMAGAYWTGSENTPCYWVDTDTSLTPLEMGIEGAATAVTVVNGDVCIAGYYSDTPHCWVNETDNALAYGTFGYAYGIAVSGSTVYTVGRNSPSGASYYPCYWTNSTRTDLPSGSSGGSAQSIQIADGSIYISGYYTEGATDYPCYWVDETGTALSCGAHGGHAYAIQVVDGVIYIAGDSYSDTDGCIVPCYWVNGAQTVLENAGFGGAAYSLSVQAP